MDYAPLLGPEKYWTYRWIHAIDGTSGDPFVLELFSSSQPEIFSRICPSKSTLSAPVRELCFHMYNFSISLLLISSTVTYLVCTQMRVCQVEGSMPYLTSSFETETFITGPHSCDAKQLTICLYQHTDDSRWMYM